MPIAVLDSGVGGISVLRELIRLMPEEHFLYLGDTKNAPYGTKSREEVLAITKENLNYLLSRGIKALVIACNTATGAAAQSLREENPSLPIIGIEPAIKPAALMGDFPRVLVMATPLTLKQEKYLVLAQKYSPLAELIPLPCPGLADLIESGKVEGEEIEAYLKSLFAPYFGENINAIVLGCTHYPHVRETVRELWGDRVAILDGGEGTARETRRRLLEARLLRQGQGSVEIISTKGDDEMIKIANKLLYR